LRRVEDGVCFPVPWSEFLAWANVANVIVRADEYAILRAVDLAFCDEMNKELQAYQDRLSAQQSREIEEAKRNR
jgi:accessory colonization factor AcfC